MNNQAIQGIKEKLVRYLVASLSSINKSTLLVKMGILTGHCNIRSKTLKRNISTVDRFLPITGIFGKKKINFEGTSIDFKDIFSRII